jgi:hypothetical protein
MLRRFTVVGFKESENFVVIKVQINTAFSLILIE